MPNRKLKIIIIYGPPCAGKSALSAMLAKDTGFKFLSTDLLRINYFDELNELYTTTNVAIIYNMLFDRIQKNNEANISVIVEGMFLTNENKLRALKYAKKTDLKFIYITADFETLATRLNDRNKKESNNILQHKVPLSIKALKIIFEASIPPINSDLIIDTSKLNMIQSFQRMKSIIAEDYSFDFLRNNIINESND
jgi:predicted kinase